MSQMPTRLLNVELTLCYFDLLINSAHARGSSGYPRLRLLLRVQVGANHRTRAAMIGLKRGIIA